MQHLARRARAGYTLAEVVGAVVVAAILLAIAAPAVANTLRIRAAEATLRSDLHSAANLLEAAYLAEGAYPEFPALQARGAPLSPGVEVDSQAVAGERVYLRLRHAPTGQRCVLDYSRSSAVARNRPDCFGGGLARDTALAITPEGPPAVPSDTFRVEPPDEPEPQNPLALASPEVGQPSDRTGAPGDEIGQVFLVTNRSPVTRSFRLETGSSNPSVVPSPMLEAERVTLSPGVPHSVHVTSTVAPGALAGAAAVIPLRVVDELDPRFGGTGAFTVTTALVLRAPAVAVAGAQPRVELPGIEFETHWNVTNRSNAARTLRLSASSTSPAHLQLLDGAPGAVPFGPGESRTVSVRARIATGSEAGTRSGITLEAADAESPEHRSTAQAAVETALVLGAPVVTPPQAHAAEPAAPFTLEWRILNVTNQARTLLVQPSVSDPDHLEIVGESGTGARTVGAGQSASAQVTYRIRPGSLAERTSEVRLLARDAAAPDYEGTAAASVRTSLAVRAPALTPPPDQSGTPGAELGVRWSIRNETNATRVLQVGTPTAAGDLTLVSASGTGELTFAPFEVRSVSAVYRVGPNAVAGSRSAPSLAVSDRLVPAASASATFEFEALPDYRAPELLPPTDRALDPGASTSVTFRIVNRSNAPQRFALQASSADQAAVAEPGAQPEVSLEAFGAAEVRVDLAAPAGALGHALAEVTLRAIDAERPAVSAEAGMRVSINPRYLPPALEFGAGRTVVPGVGARDTATVLNRSNVPLEFCFTASADAGTVAAGQVVLAAVEAPPCLTLGPAATAGERARVEVSYASAEGALAGWTNEVVLRAVQRSPETMEEAARLPVTAALVLRAPVWEALPASPQSWEVGETRALPHEYRNTTNAPRRFCVELVSGEPAQLAPDPAGPICGEVVGPGERAVVTPRLHALAPSAGELSVEARVYDQDAPDFVGTGAFQSVVRATRPVARWKVPAPAYVRKWLTFDASESHSPVGAEIVRYMWSWGLIWQRWDETQGRFVWGDEATARDEVSTPVVRRAFDWDVLHEVCLTVVDEAGRSSVPECQTVEVVRKTQARLSWRYRGWWRGNNCIDVPWDSQCPKEHGNSRWEIDLRPSLGGVPIQRAYATVRVALHNTDDPNRPWSGTYSGNADVPAWSTYGFDDNWPMAAGSAQQGRWRVLDTEGTEPAGWPRSLEAHPLVQNVNLGAATGIYDTGPHWVPDDVWITLHVQDAHGEWTSMRGHHDHPRSDWRSRISKPYVEQGPQVWIRSEPTGPGSYHVSGDGESHEGRIVSSEWTVVVHSPMGQQDSYTRRETEFEVVLGMCESATVYLSVTDELGRSSSASKHLAGPSSKVCFEPPAPQ